MSNDDCVQVHSRSGVNMSVFVEQTEWSSCSPGVLGNLASQGNGHPSICYAG